MLQGLRGDEYSRKAELNYTRQVPDPAMRGVIFSREGILLAENKPSYEIVYNSLGHPRSVRRESISAFSEIFQIDKDEIIERIRNTPRESSGDVPIFRGLEFADVVPVAERQLELSGVFQVRSTPRRHYPYGKYTSHLIGYLGEVSQEELDSDDYSDFKMGDLLGRSGIEKSYQYFLKGRDGVKSIQVFANGIMKEDMKEGTRSVPGNNLYTTLNLELQIASTEALSASCGAVAVMDPGNGDVLALVSSPGYDINIFGRKVDAEVYSNLVNDASHPFTNRAFSEYPPGSILKPAVSFGALEKGVIDAHTTFFCNGRFHLHGHEWKCWRLKYGGHGKISVVNAIKGSCDVYFYELGKRLGMQGMAEIYDAFGLGQTTGIDLPNEKPGLIPHIQKGRRGGWFYRIPKAGWKQWFDGDTINASIGQGDILVTPIQMAVMTSAVANKGTVWKPRLVSRITNSKGLNRKELQPEPAHPIIKGTSDNWNLIHEAMWETVNQRYGTGYDARIPGLDICGKTGSAQSGPGLTHAWFICFAPRDNPEIAVAVVVEQSGHGGDIAAPIAKKILEVYFKQVTDALGTS